MDWNRLTQEGNTRFRAGSFAEAIALYETAVDVVRDLTKREPLTPPMLMARIVSHHNLAAALQRLGRLDDAASEYEAAHAFVRGVAADPAQPPALRASAQAHCAVTFTEWQAFRREQGLDEAGPPSPREARRPALRLVH